MTQGSLFDGIAGFPYAASKNKIETLWGSEIEPFPILVTKKHFPNMRHLGDISQVNGAELEQVDIISGGSPCQDLSVAGLRKGLKHDDLGSEENTRSGLFMEQIRIVRELRNATGKPRFMLWENVPGAFSSNGGEDFRIVLEKAARIKDSAVVIPRPAKWSDAGCIMGNGWSIAWRVLDAQYWGVSQRRRRIFLVADFDGECAGEILFKRGGLSRYSAESGEARKGTAGNAADSVGKAICIDHAITTGGNCTAQGSCVYEDDICATLKQSGVHAVFPSTERGVGETGGFIGKLSGKTRGIGWANEQAPTLDTSPPNVVSIHQNQCGELRTGDKANTLNTNSNPSGRNAPLVMEMTHADEAIRFHKDGIAPTLQSRMGTGGNQVNALLDKTWPEKSMPVMARDYKGPKNYQDGGLQNSVVNNMAVRRLLPIECLRLQAFPDNWFDDLAIENPTEQDIAFWDEVFRTHARIMGGKTKSRNQIIKWLKKPYSDSAAYKAIGNSIATVCAEYVFEGIAEVLGSEKRKQWIAKYNQLKNQ